MPAEPYVLEEFLNVMAGEAIGSGMSRKVFELPHSPDYVAKIEEGPHMFQNVMEWIIWNQVSETKWAKWFAPCKSISPNGHVLIMRRTNRPTKRQYPDQVPIFLTDLKVTNFGTIGRNFVCHDYGSCLLPTYGLTDRMRKAVWWE